LVFVLAVVLSGCAEEIYQERFEPGDIDIYDDLYSVSAVGDDHVWAAGYFGTLYRSTDSGKTWRKLTSGTQKSINALSFADERHGWAVGRMGFVTHTVDGGETWEQQVLPRTPAQHLFSVFALSPQTAWIVGTWGGRYYTENGGKTWQDRSLIVTEGHPVFKYLTEVELERYRGGETIYDDVGLNDVAFLDDKHGWIVGEWGYTWWTDDGGATWNDGRIIGDVAFDDVYFEAASAKLPREYEENLESVGEVLSKRDYLRVRIEAFVTQKEYDVRQDTFLADDRADNIKTFLEDLGINPDRLRVENRTPFDEEVVDMAVFRKNKIKDRPYAVIRVVESPYLFDVKFRDLENGLVAGLGGVIMKSDDGGQTWRYMDTESRQAFFSVGFRPDRAVAVGEKGLKRRSMDDGRTWRGFEDGFPTLFTFMRDMTFVGRDRGWIVGQSGTVLRTADGGATWIQVLPPGKDGRAELGAGE
jgi:photosystem II stability/assembly factor-like uncharacterized protein